MLFSVWSSDVCSSDLRCRVGAAGRHQDLAPFGRRRAVVDLSISAVEDGVGGAGKMPGPAGLGSALRGAGVGGDEPIGDAVPVVGQGLAAQALDDDKVACLATQPPEVDRKSVGVGRSVAGRVELGGGRLLEKKKT